MREVTGYLDSFLPSFARLNQLPATPALTAATTDAPYANPYYAIVDVFQERSKPTGTLYCYNCGQSGHLGNDCTEKTLDDLTKDSKYSSSLSMST